MDPAPGTVWASRALGASFLILWGRLVEPLDSAALHKLKAKVVYSMEKKSISDRDVSPRTWTQDVAWSR